MNKVAQVTLEIPYDAEGPHPSEWEWSKMTAFAPSQAGPCSLLSFRAGKYDPDDGPIRIPGETLTREEYAERYGDDGPCGWRSDSTNLAGPTFCAKRFGHDGGHDFEEARDEA